MRDLRPTRARGVGTLKVGGKCSDSKRVSGDTRSRRADPVVDRVGAGVEQPARTLGVDWTMGTGSEFARHRPRGNDARPDERFVRILFVEDRPDLADEIRQTLGAAGRASFEVICESDLVAAAAQIRGDSFDLLLLDPQLPQVDRRAAIELASDLAHRLPVVVLTGTEHLRERAQTGADGAVDVSGPPAAVGDVDEPTRRRLRECIRHADIAGKLLSAIRRSRRLGTGVMSPIFCRLERPLG